MPPRRRPVGLCAPLLCVCLCLCLSACCLLVGAQEDPREVYLWWEHEEHGHRDLIARLQRHSALKMKQRQQAGEQGGDNPLLEAFERTNTHAFVIHGPHPARAENVRNFSRALGFGESGGRHLTKIYTVL